MGLHLNSPASVSSGGIRKGVLISLTSLGQTPEKLNPEEAMFILVRGFRGLRPRLVGSIAFGEAEHHGGVRGGDKVLMSWQPGSRGRGDGDRDKKDIVHKDIPTGPCYCLGVRQSKNNQSIRELVH